MRQTFILLGIGVGIVIVLIAAQVNPAFAVRWTALGMATVLGVYAVARVLHRLYEVVALLRRLEERDRVGS